MDRSTEASDLTDLFCRVRLVRNREHAGAQLATRLEALYQQDVLVLGIPRGGVPVAAQIARRLNADLDVVVVRKLGAPCQPELAVGAVAADGSRYLNDALIQEMGVTAEVLEWLIRSETAEARGRAACFRGSRPPPRIEGRTVVIVDDWLSTGATMCRSGRARRVSTCAMKPTRSSLCTSQNHFRQSVSITEVEELLLMEHTPASA
jgi:putative phosphoribosyl transferase